MRKVDEHLTGFETSSHCPLVDNSKYLLHPSLCIPTDDASRVVLSVPDANGSDYINASYIDVRMHSIFND